MPVTLVDPALLSSETATDLAYYESPIGLVEIGGTPSAITCVNFVDKRRRAPGSDPLVAEALRQISAYFRGKCQDFDLPVALCGTDFQCAVWRQLTTVAYGRTASYGHIAAGIGRPKAVRAVGGANGKNPLTLVVPCHRIIGSDGSLTGYGSGLWRKQWLLDHERAFADE